MSDVDDALLKVITDLTRRAIVAEDRLAQIEPKYNRLVAAMPDCVEALSEVSEYLDNYIDAEIDAETGRTIPNDAMRLQSMVDEALEKAQRT